MTDLLARKRAERARQASEECPYPGPAPYAMRQGHFHGRGAETAAISSLLHAHQAVLLHAPSGAGKTSLIRAQLVPALERKGFTYLGIANVGPSAIVTSKLDWRDPKVVPNLYVAAALGSLDPDQPIEDVAGMSLDGWLADREEAHDKYGDPRPALLVLDQFEEILEPFERDDWLTSRVDFVVQLRRALRADPELRVLIAIREDHLAAIDRLLERLPERAAAIRLDRLKRAAAAKAIELPAQATGVSFAEGVVPALLDGLATRKVEGFDEPVPSDFVVPAQLQVVMRKLWLDAVKSPKRRIEKVGKLEEALAEHYKEAVKGAAAWWQRPLVRWFVRSRLITPHKTRKLYPRTSETRTWLLPNKVLDKLEHDYGLVRRERRGGTSYWELSHDGFVEPVVRVNTASNRNWMRAFVTLLAIAFVFVAYSASRQEGRPQVTIASMALPPEFEGVTDVDIERLYDGDFEEAVTFRLPEGQRNVTVTIEFDRPSTISDMLLEPGREHPPIRAFLAGQIEVPIGEARIRRQGQYGAAAQKIQLTMQAPQLSQEIEITEIVFFGRPVDE